MKIKSSSIAVLAIALCIALVSLTSCNRGYGCPYELKAPASIIKLK